MVPALHGEDSVDGITISFLLAKNLKLTKEEEAGVGGEGEGGGEGEDDGAVVAGAPLVAEGASRPPLVPASEQDQDTLEVFLAQALTLCVSTFL